MHGRPRDSGLRVLFILFTGGLYWFYWLLRALPEVESERRVRWRIWACTAPLPILALVAVVAQHRVSALLGSSAGSYFWFYRGLGNRAEAFLEPTGLAAACALLVAATLAFFQLQGLVLLEASRRFAARGAPRHLPLSSVLLSVGGVVMAIGLPLNSLAGSNILLGHVMFGLGMGGLLVFVVAALTWYESAQAALNDHWRAVRAPSPLDPVAPSRPAGPARA